MQALRQRLNFVLCTAYSTVTARSLAGPSLDLLDILVAESISTAAIRYKGNLAGGQSLSKICAATSCLVLGELFAKGIVSGR